MSPWHGKTGKPDCAREDREVQAWANGDAL